MKVNTNVLYYFRKGREYDLATRILENLKIEYVAVRIHERMWDKKFLNIILEFCQNGFDDILKNQNKVKEAVDDSMTTNKLINLLVETYDEYAKPVFFLGKNGIVTSKLIEDEFTIHIPYKNREMSKIYE